MTMLERQVRSAQRRLWLNRFLQKACGVVGVGAVLFGAVVAVQRLYDLAAPIGWIGLGIGAASLIAAVVWTTVTREESIEAAAALDQAAGLKERISSGCFCVSSEDPFDRAVVADAEEACQSVSVRQHLRPRWPKSLALSSCFLILAALMFLITPGLLANSEVKATQEVTEEYKKAHVAVKKRLAALREEVERNPALADLKEKLDGLDQQAGGQLNRPGDLRHEAVKKIDKLADAIKQRQQSGKYSKTRAMRKMFRRMTVPASSDAPTQKLARSLAKGDVKSAKEEINKIKEQLATLKSENDQELAARLGKKLEELARQLQKQTDRNDVAKKLEQAGIKKKDLERMLEKLTKKDLDQLKKQLEKKGLSQKQIEKLAKQLQSQRGATSAAKQLAKAIQQAGAGAQAGQMGEAIAGLSQAGEQLSELEMMDAELAQMQSTMQSLQQARCGLDGN